MTAAVDGGWYGVARQAGVTERDYELIRSAFVYEGFGYDLNDPRIKTDDAKELPTARIAKYSAGGWRCGPAATSYRVLGRCPSVGGCLAQDFAIRDLLRWRWNSPKAVDGAAGTMQIVGRAGAPGLVRLSFGQSTHDAAQDRQCLHGAVVRALFEVCAALGHGVRHVSQAEHLVARRRGECIQSGRLHFDC